MACTTHTRTPASQAPARSATACRSTKPTGRAGISPARICPVPPGRPPAGPAGAGTAADPWPMNTGPDPVTTTAPAPETALPVTTPCSRRSSASPAGPGSARPPITASPTARTSSPPTRLQMITASCAHAHLAGSNDVATFVAPPSAATTKAVRPARNGGHHRRPRRLFEAPDIRLSSPPGVDVHLHQASPPAATATTDTTRHPAYPPQAANDPRLSRQPQMITLENVTSQHLSPPNPDADRLFRNAAALPPERASRGQKACR